MLVPGNNETVDALRDAARSWAAATVLHGEGTAIDGTEFFGLGAGIPVTPWDWSFDLDDDEATGDAGALPGGSGAGPALAARGATATAPATAPTSAARRCCGRSRRSGRGWRSAATSTSPGAARAEIGSTPIRNLGPTGTWIEL